MGRPKRQLPDREGSERDTHYCMNKLEDTEVRDGVLYLRHLCRGCGKWTEAPAAVELPKKETA